VADAGNYTIRKVVIATGEVTTLVGTPGTRGSSDGLGAAASLDESPGITTDGINLYLADHNNHTVRKVVIATGAVSTVAGVTGISGSTDGVGAAARFLLPSDITTDGKGLFVVDSGNNTIRKIH
jgi:hypothetical protein